MQKPSENAKEAGVNPMGSAGFHYDMEYINESDELIYVEVKTSASPVKKKIEFYMSKDEVEFAKQNHSQYELFYVSDINGTPSWIKFNNLFTEDTVNTEQFMIEEETEYKFLGKLR